MKIVLAPDSFKGSMTAKQVALSMQRGLEKVLHRLNDFLDHSCLNDA